MNELIKEWFSNLIDEEIETELKTIGNESIWEMSDDGDIHTQNITEHEKSIEFLKAVKEKYCS